MVSAPFCGKVLAELGADVVKVEPPVRGDESRGLGPFPGGKADPEASGVFLFANLNKRGVTLDLEDVQGRGVMERLLAAADVLLENQPGDALRKAGLDYESLKDRFPRLIVTSISPYGRSGAYKDYKGYDLTANAMSGLSFGTGHSHREPLTTPMHQASYLAGVGAAFATLAAILGRDLTGRGQLVDVAEAQVIGTLLTGYHLPTYIYRGVAGFRSGNRMRLGLFPNCVLPCRDGYVCIDAPQMEQYQRFLALLGDQEWMSEARYRDRRAMSDQYPEEAESLIAPWFMERTKEEILQACLENRIPCVPVKTFDEVLADPQLNARDYFHSVEHPRSAQEPAPSEGRGASDKLPNPAKPAPGERSEGKGEGATLRTGHFSYPGAPYRLSATPCRVTRAAPTLGQHNGEVLAGELGLSEAELSALAAAGVI